MSRERILISNGNPMEKIVGFSRAVRVGSFVAVGGTAPVDAEGKPSVSGMYLHKPSAASRSSKRRWSRQGPDLRTS